MKSFQVLAMVCLVVAKVRSAPLAEQQPENDLFAGFLRNAQLGTPSKESDIVKRRIVDYNPDRELKQISLQSLIGDLENSLFASALSVHQVVQNPDSAEIPEIKPDTDTTDPQHRVTRRHSDTDDSNIEASTEPQERKVILQTTEKIPQANGGPAHIIIDRIAIEPQLVGKIPLIPTFEIKHTSTRDSDRKPEITKISITKTEISAVPNTPAPTTSTTTTSATTTVSAPTTAVSKAASNADNESTTPKTIEHLKEVEEELKGKVAEIEAEPIILSARV